MEQHTFGTQDIMRKPHILFHMSMRSPLARGSEVETNETVFLTGYANVGDMRDFFWVVNGSQGGGDFSCGLGPEREARRVWRNGDGGKGSTYGRDCGQLWRLSRGNWCCRLMREQRVCCGTEVTHVESRGFMVLEMLGKVC